MYSLNQEQIPLSNEDGSKILIPSMHSSMKELRLNPPLETEYFEKRNAVEDEKKR